MSSAQVHVKLAKQDISIQCELLLDGLHAPTQQFDIADRQLRRRLVRRLYCLLMLEAVLTIPCLELLIRYQLFCSTQLLIVVVVAMLFIYTSLYIWRDWRRASPYNYMVYLLIILSSAISRSLLVQNIGHTRWLYGNPLILSVELLILALYSKQNCVKFSLVIGIFIICVVLGLFLVLAYVFNIDIKVLAMFNCAVEAFYVIYDTSLMLSGGHGYNVGPSEYFYAACNIYADLPNLLWTLCKLIIFSPIVAIVRSFRYVRVRKVC